MSRAKPPKKKSASRPAFDKYVYYNRSVQSPDVDTEFVADCYKELRGGQARVLREDFCGGFAVCCEWVKRHKKNRAIGIDLDELPATPDRVMQALVERRRAERLATMRSAAS